VLKDVFALLPVNHLPILIEQQIPSPFCGAFAKMPKDFFSFEVREAGEGYIFRCGLALVAVESIFLSTKSPSMLRKRPERLLRSRSDFSQNPTLTPAFTQNSFPWPMSCSAVIATL
jgi:chemotaxis response regulator CheB